MNDASTAAKLEADVRAGKPIAVIELPHAIKAESAVSVQNGKPSLLSRLEDAKQAVERNKQTSINSINNNKKERTHE